MNHVIASLGNHKVNCVLIHIQLNDHEMMVAANLVDPSSISVSWQNIGGLSELIGEMKV